MADVKDTPMTSAPDVAGLIERLRTTSTKRTWDSVGRPYDYPEHLPREAADVLTDLSTRLAAAEAERDEARRLHGKLVLDASAQLAAAEARVAKAVEAGLRADLALQKISLMLGGTDEWADQETMIAYVLERVETLAQSPPPAGVRITIDVNPDGSTSMHTQSGVDFDDTLIALDKAQATIVAEIKSAKGCPMHTQPPAGVGQEPRRPVTVEDLAKHLHDEEHQHDWTWPEHENDEGYRGNGAYVRITPIDVQLECREEAKRIWTLLGMDAAPSPQDAIRQKREDEREAILAMLRAQIERRAINDAERLKHRTVVSKDWVDGCRYGLQEAEALIRARSQQPEAREE